MASRIEQIIDEIEEYIDNCKTYPLSSAKIIVNKDEIEELISELRNKAPEEIKRCQKIASNEKVILTAAQAKADRQIADAQAQAEAIISNAQVKTDELINEHQIMQSAYAQANEVVMLATKQAQEILDTATNDANNIRLGAVQYTNDILTNLENAIARSMDAAKARHDSYIGSLQEFYDIVSANRAELNPNAKSDYAASDLTAENETGNNLKSDMIN